MTNPPPHPQALELRAGPLRLALRADLGASIAGLWHDGVAVMRSTAPEALPDVRAAACFPLVPYSNRLGYRRFAWQGAAYETQPNFPVGPHSLHGVAWQRAWHVVEHSACQARLRYVHRPDGHWPFAFEVEQGFELAPDRLTLTLRFTNTDHHTQPVGLGWHPYFPKREGSRVDVEVTHRWAADPDTLLPTERLPQPAGLHDDVAALDLDHCFEGWTGPARLGDRQVRVALTSSLRYLVVFTPPTKDFFCVEPVSHLNDAIHRDDPCAHGLQAVEAGTSVEAWMHVAVSAP